MSSRINYGHVAWFPDQAAGTVRLGDREVPRVVRAEIGDPLSGDPLVRVYLEVVGDRPQCRQVHFVSVPEAGAWMMDPHGRELRQGDIDGFRIAEWIERVFVLSAWPAYLRDAVGPGVTGTDYREAASQALHEFHGKPRRVDRAFLEQVAEVYRRNVDNNPTQSIERAFGTSYRTAARYVERARAADLLPETTPGKRKA